MNKLDTEYGRKTANNDDNLGDISTLADPDIINHLIKGAKIKNSN